MKLSPKEVLYRTGKYDNQSYSVWLNFLFIYGFISYGEMKVEKANVMASTFSLGY